MGSKNGQERIWLQGTAESQPTGCVHLTFLIHAWINAYACLEASQVRAGQGAVHVHMIMCQYAHACIRAGAPFIGMAMRNGA
eukprot:6058235-Alexandrium_andersonii.AAC.1